MNKKHSLFVFSKNPPLTEQSDGKLVRFRATANNLSAVPVTTPRNHRQRKEKTDKNSSNRKTANQTLNQSTKVGAGLFQRVKHQL